MVSEFLRVRFEPVYLIESLQLSVNLDSILIYLGIWTHNF